MKKTTLIFLILACFLVPGLFSLDLELRGGFGNVAYDDDLAAPLSAGEGEAFESRFFPLVLVQISGETDSFAFNGGFERDPMLKNRLFANARIDFEYFYLEAGPFFGVFNSGKLPVNPGISTALGAMVPGVVFAEARGSSTLAAVSLEKKGRYSEFSGDLALGFWVPHVVCSLNMNYENFSRREEADLLIENELTRYYLRADAYSKNVPYTIKVDLGYQNLSRAYASRKIENGAIKNASETDAFKSIFIGAEAAYTFNSALKVYLGGEAPVYSWAVRPMKDPPKDSPLFKVWAGLVWELPF